MNSFLLSLVAFAFFILPVLFFLVRYPGGYSKRTVMIVRVTAGIWLVCSLVLVWLDFMGSKMFLITWMHQTQKWVGGIILAAIAAFVPDTILDKKK